MALVTALFTKLNIVLAADGCLHAFAKRDSASMPEPLIRHGAKLIFACPNHAALAFVGTAAYNGEPVEEAIRNLIENRIRPDSSREDRSWMVMDHFGAAPPKISVLLARMEEGTPKLSKLHLDSRKVELVGTGKPGLTWIGEGSVLNRLLANGYTRGADGEEVPLAPAALPWGMMNNREAAELSAFLINTSATYAKFRVGIPLVEEASDILVLGESGMQWRMKNKKEL